MWIEEIRLICKPMLFALVVLVGQGPAVARSLDVGPGKPYTMPSQAAAAARDGDHVVIAPGVYHDCAIWRADHLTIEGAGPASGVVITDKICAGKALFVTSGSNITIRNLTLRDARVPDHNGAAIRAEGPFLTVDHVDFRDNEEGILSGASRTSVITVRDSTFEGNGSCLAACAHGIYAGDIARLRVERSRFSETRQGHHIKSRAERTEIVGCDIEDGARGTASYLIDVPNGGAVEIRDNILEKGPASENTGAAIIIGEEGVSHPTPSIFVSHNRFRNDGRVPTRFVDNRTATAAVLTANTLSGEVTALEGPGSSR